MDHLCRSDLRERPQAGLQELMRAIIMRANFIPAVRRRLGWRGIHQCPGPPAGWTARIRGLAGVFGLSYRGWGGISGWVRGGFDLYYFPHPEEDLVEGCAVAAAMVIADSGYFGRVRDFQADPAFGDLFAIAEIALAVNPERTAVGLGLSAFSRLRLIAEEGIAAPTEAGPVVLVEPGGFDQDFPAFETAMAFFEVLAASATFNLGQAPEFFGRDHFSGEVSLRDRRGTIQRRAAEDIQRSNLVIAYGDGDAAALLPIPEAAPLHHRSRWHNGAPLPPEDAQRLWWMAHHIENLGGVDKKALGIDERPVLIVLTGFLGAGKTSFLRHFIEYQAQMNRFVAVVQNEIGAVGLDGKLMEEDVAVVEMDEGCVCCSLIGNLKTAIRRILSEFQPDVIVLETTGLANPFNLLEDLEELEEQVRFDSVTTVMDAAQAMITLERHEVAVEQVRAADIVLINKSDLVDGRTMQQLRERLSAINPRAAMLTATRGYVPAGLFYGTDPLMEDEGAYGRQGNAVATPRPTHRQDGIQTLKCEFRAPLDRDRFLQAIAAQMPPTMLRIKGILEFSDDPDPVVFQYVAGRFDFTALGNPRVKERFLVFIGQDLDVGKLQKAIGGQWGGPSHRNIHPTPTAAG